MTPVMAASAMAKQAEHRKQDGNVLFQSNQFIAAIHAYTEHFLCSNIDILTYIYVFQRSFRKVDMKRFRNNRSTGQRDFNSFPNIAGDILNDLVFLGWFALRNIILQSILKLGSLIGVSSMFIRIFSKMKGQP
ncbi:hypothetical protein H5410_047116 [Solanum commersonii]|uniref:Uncharacterized protein n=1 Tax=Solanum commersonii TaxID=4109 RepID=A0A9J5XG95_SOLCO|nr:hypothetical protein H5410_047116 [Solanum commersonii]